jgi:electron transport complex protein RnfA
MSSLLVIVIGTVLVNTFLLSHRDVALTGDAESVGVSNAIRIAVASFITLVLSAILALIAWRLMRQTLGDVMMFVFSIAVVLVAVGLHRLARRRLPLLRRSLASSPILIVSNCLALGVILSNAIFDATALTAIGSTIALGTGFGGALVAFVALAARIYEREVPAPFRFAPVTLVSAGLVALALTGFAGLLRI